MPDLDSVCDRLSSTTLMTVINFTNYQCVMRVNMAAARPLDQSVDHSRLFVLFQFIVLSFSAFLRVLHRASLLVL